MINWIGEQLMGKKKKKPKLGNTTTYLTPKKAVVYEECHTGCVFAFADPKSSLKFYGGGRQREAVPGQDWTILALTNNMNAFIRIEGPNAIQLPSLRHLMNDVIHLDWHDGHASCLFPEEWKYLLEDLRKLASGKEEYPVLVCCEGGHGRTGTALAILAYLSGAYPHADVVSWLREKYCHKAVETVSQIMEIEKIVGQRIKEEPAYALRTQAVTSQPSLPVTPYVPAQTYSIPAMTTIEKEVIVSDGLSVEIEEVVEGTPVTQRTPTLYDLTDAQFEEWVRQAQENFKSDLKKGDRTNEQG